MPASDAQYAILIAALQDTAVKDYPSMTDQAAYDALMAVDQDGDVPVTEIKTFMALQGTYGKLVNSTSDVAENVRSVLDDDRLSDIDFNLPQIEATLAALVAETPQVLTQGEADSIAALKENRQSHAEKLGIAGWLTVGRVLHARELTV